jgi:hypothetical protein
MHRTKGLKTPCSCRIIKANASGPYGPRVVDRPRFGSVSIVVGQSTGIHHLFGSFTIEGLPTAMKLTPLFIVFALIVANIPSPASGQTKSSAPPPPSLAKSSAKGKGKRAIPPPPPISSMKSAHKKRRSSASKVGDYQAPGRDMTGRADLSAKRTGFYPITKGVDIVNPSQQQSAIRAGKR